MFAVNQGNDEEAKDDEEELGRSHGGDTADVAPNRVCTKARVFAGDRAIDIGPIELLAASSDAVVEVNRCATFAEAGDFVCLP